MRTILPFGRALLLFCFCLLTSLAYTQVTQQWTARYNGTGKGSDLARAVAVDSSGNVYVTGSSGTLKYNAQGVQQWTRRGNQTALVIDGSGNVYVTGEGGTSKYNTNGNELWSTKDKGNALAVDSSGSVYITSSDKGDYATTKYDLNGKALWVSRYEGLGNGADVPASIAVDTQGNVYVTGSSAGDYATVKYNANGKELWVKRYNSPENHEDKAQDLAVDASGNVYVTGNSANFANDTFKLAAVTIKYDTNGKELWESKYNSFYHYPFTPVSSLAIDGKGNVYVTGQSSGMDNYFPDYATIKYDANGNELWVKTYGGLGGSVDIANSVAVDRSGNVYVTGKSTGILGDGYFDYERNYGTIKYDANGKELWVKTYENSAFYQDRATSLAVDDSGNVYVTGYRNPVTGGGASESDYATIKYDTNGSELWVSLYDGGSRDIATLLTVDAKGNVYVSGRSNGPGGDENPASATIKYDSSGKELWVRRYGAPDVYSNYKVATSLVVAPSGNVYVTGTEYDTYTTTIKYGTNGEELWINGNGTYYAEATTSLAVDAQENVYVTGQSSSDYSTIKYDVNGNELWVRRYNGLGDFSNDLARSVAVDRAGNVYVTGQSGSYLGVPGTYDYDYSTIKYDTEGNEVWVRRYKGGSASFIAVDSAANVYVTGNNGTIKYNSQGEEQWVGSSKGTFLAVDKAGNVYVQGDSTIKYNSNGQKQWARSGGATLALDAQGNVYVTGTSGGDYVTIKYDSNGNQVWIEKFNGPDNGNDKAHAVVVDAKGNVYVTGGSEYNETGYDFVTIKYSQTPPSPPLVVNAGKDKSTYYLPFTPTCAFLNAQAKGGTPPYQYSWSPNGATSQSTIVCPSSTTTYTVMVTDSIGQKATDQVKVNVVDVRCGTYKQNLVVCHGGTVLCLSPWETFWHLWHGDALGSCPLSNVLTSNTSKNREDRELPTRFKVYNAPNPFSNTTRIYYELPRDGKVLIKVYDALGREVSTLVNRDQKAGTYSSEFSASALTKGVYYYRVTYTIANKQVLEKNGKMILVK